MRPIVKRRMVPPKRCLVRSAGVLSIQQWTCILYLYFLWPMSPEKGDTLKSIDCSPYTSTTMFSVCPPSPSYIKLIRKDRIHNGLVLIEGLNCLKPGETFYPNPACGPGGLYFCKEEDVYHWLKLYKENLGFVATVTLCSDSTVITMDIKLKTGRFFLGAFQPIEDYLTAERTVHIIQQGHTLEYIPQSIRTFNVCFAAVQQKGNALEYVPTLLKTPELCLAAVQQNGGALAYVPEALRTPELYGVAVQQKGYVLACVPILLRTPELCLIATGNQFVRMPMRFIGFQRSFKRRKSVLLRYSRMAVY